jgi:hypothetical protein
VYAYSPSPDLSAGVHIIGLANVAARRRAAVLTLRFGQEGAHQRTRAKAVTESLDLTPQEQIGRYLELAQQARKNAKAPYAGLFAAIPPDPQTLMIQELAMVYAIVGVLLFIAAMISIFQSLFGNSAVRNAVA